MILQTVQYGSRHGSLLPPHYPFSDLLGMPLRASTRTGCCRALTTGCWTACSGHGGGDKDGLPSDGYPEKPFLLGGSSTGLKNTARAGMFQRPEKAAKTVLPGHRTHVVGVCPGTACPHDGHPVHWKIFRVQPTGMLQLGSKMGYPPCCPL